MDASPSVRGLRLLYGATFCHFTAMGMFLAALQLFVRDELGGSRAAVGLSVGAFSVSALLVRPFVGRAIDAKGRRPFLLGALVLVLLSSLGFLLADSLAAVVALRLVHGVAGGTFYTTAAAVATDLAPPERRASAIARFSLFLYAGFAIGPALAESLAGGVGFPAVWLVAAGLALGATAFVAALPESGEPAIARRAELGPTARRLLHPAAVGPGLVLMSAGVGYVSVSGFSTLYAREVGVSGGLLYATFAVTVLCVRLVAGRLADTMGRVEVALPGLLVGAAGLAALAVVQRPVAAVIGVAAYGAGFALVLPALMALTVDRVEDHERGEALGSFTAFMDLGSGAGGYLVGALADASGFGAAYGVPALLVLGGAALLSRLSGASSSAPGLRRGLVARQ